VLSALIVPCLVVSTLASLVEAKVCLGNNANLLVPENCLVFLLIISRRVQVAVRRASAAIFQLLNSYCDLPVHILSINGFSFILQTFISSHLSWKLLHLSSFLAYFILLHQHQHG